MQLITEIPFTGTGDTTSYADDYTIKTCTDAPSTSETLGSPVWRHTTPLTKRILALVDGPVCKCHTGISSVVS